MHGSQPEYHLNMTNSACTQRSDHLRFKPHNITHKLPFIPLVVAHLAGPVEEFDAFHPFAYREFDFAGEVMEVWDQCGHDFSHSGRRVGAH